MPLVKAQCTNCGQPLEIDIAQGVAVCPFCQTPYIMEKATDGSRSQVENLESLYIVARRARKEMAFDLAQRIYEKILAVDPMDWEAYFFTGYFTAAQLKNMDVDGAADRVRSSLPSSLLLIRDHTPPEKWKEHIEEIISYTFLMADHLETYVKKQFKLWIKYPVYQKAILKLQKTLGTHIEQVFARYPDFCKEHALFVWKELYRNGQIGPEQILKYDFQKQQIVKNIEQNINDLQKQRRQTKQEADNAYSAPISVFGLIGAGCGVLTIFSAFWGIRKLLTVGLTASIIAAGICISLVLMRKTPKRSAADAVADFDRQIRQLNQQKQDVVLSVV